MGCKLPGSSLATGYWGRNPKQHIRELEIPEKLKVLLLDKLRAMGRPVALWLLVNENTPGVFPCTCEKETMQASDMKCLSCYGTKLVPGYQKFLHDTLHASSAEHVADGTYTLTSTVVDYTIKPNRIKLANGVLTGTIETVDQPFSNPDSGDWEFQVAAYRKRTGDDILAEFSTNAGGTWTDLTLINGAAKPTGAGSIRFRITLTRTTVVNTDSPDFAILRIRRVATERQNPIWGQDCPVSTAPEDREVPPGTILVLRTWQIERTQRTLNLGRQTDWTSDKAWTAPLDAFDTTITGDTPPARIFDEDAGPHPFYQHAYGIERDERMAIYQVSFNEQLLTFTHQAFFDRRTQKGEVYHRVF